MNTYTNEIIATLQAEGIETPRLEAKLMIAKVLGIDSNDSFAENISFTDSQKEKLQKIVQARLMHRPLCKVLGEKGFYKYDFLVSENVLSPRPDTETLVEAAIAEAKKNSSQKILDLGTGSGCIILSILGDVDSLQGWAIDVSAAALDVAIANAKRLQLDSRVTFINASWFDNLEPLLGNDFDIIVSNPPYIPHKDISKLDEEVKNYDPMMALDGGADGLDHYRQIAIVAIKLLRPGGMIFLEGGIYQEQDIADIFIEQGFSLQNIIKDLSGINRCIFLKK